MPIETKFQQIQLQRKRSQPNEFKIKYDKMVEDDIMYSRAGKREITQIDSMPNLVQKKSYDYF